MATWPAVSCSRPSVCSSSYRITDRARPLPAGARSDITPALCLRAPSAAPVPVAPDVVPLSLYNELLMKHEQILVQYGMIRAGGQKLLEYKADAESKAEEIRDARERYDALRQRALKEIGLLRKQ